MDKESDLCVFFHMTYPGIHLHIRFCMVYYIWTKQYERADRIGRVTQEEYCMRLGIAASLPHETPEEWAKKHKDAGLGAVVFPCNADAPREWIERYRDAAWDNDLVIAEVGIWNNPLDRDPQKRKQNLDRCIAQLALADFVHANCCVNISGSTGALWDGGYAENYTRETFEEIVETVRYILDAVHPTHTEYSLEPMPYMLPDSPETYLELARAVDRPGFGFHMDAVNLLNSPRRYFGNREFVSHCFSLLGNRVKSCHLKDTRMEPSALTVTIRECVFGEGGFDMLHYIRTAEAVDPEMPMIIEHLPTYEAYDRAVAHIRMLTEADGKQ